MRKIISMIIALAMLVSMQGFSAAFAAESGTTKYEETAKKLYGIGAISDVSANPEEKITRGNFADLAYTAFEVPQNYSGLQSMYSDVYYGESYYNSVNMLCSRGMIDNGGEFRPDAPVKLQEAAKIVVELLGYGTSAQRSGGYESGYLMIAAEKDILDGIKANAVDELTIGEAYVMIMNALEAPTCEVEYSGSKVTYNTDGAPVLENKYDTYKAKGRITANELTAINIYGKSAGKGCVVIDEETYYVGDTDITEQLGKSVDFYYKDDNGEKTVMYYAVNENRCKTIEIAAEDISEGTTVGNIIYYDGNKQKNINIGTNIDFVYNGAARVLDNPAYLKPDAGTVTVMDTDNNGSYDFISVESYLTYIADAVNTEKSVVYDRFGQGSLTLDDKLDYLKISDGTETYTVNQLNKDDVLLVRADSEYIDGDGNRKINRSKLSKVSILLSRQKLVGIPDSINDDGFTMYGKEYKLSEYYKQLIENGKLEKITLGGTAYQYYVDYYGNIVGYNTNSLSSKNNIYYIVKAYRNETDEICVRTYNIDTKSFTEIKCALKVNIDGTSYSDDNLLKKLNENSKYIAQLLVRNGELKRVTTGVKGSTTLSKDIEVDSVNYNQISHSFDDKAIIGNDTKVIKVPAQDSERQNDIEDYAVYTISDMTYERSGLKIKAYNLSDLGVAEYVVIYGEMSSTVIGDQTYYGVVDKMSLSWVEEKSEACTLVEGKLFNFVTRKIEDFAMYYDPEKVTITGGTLSVGDVVRIIADDRNYIGACQIVVDVDGGNKIKTAYDMSTSFGANFRKMFGVAYDGNDDIVGVIATDTPAADEPKYFFSVSQYNMDFVLVYDGESKEVRRGTLKDIIKYSSCGNAKDASKLAMCSSKGQMRTIVVLNNME